jgi:hypothetical protein
MARKEQVTCDVCGKLKQETNRWFVVSKSDDRVSVMGRRVLYGEEMLYDCCGESCVLKKVSELISK